MNRRNFIKAAAGAGAACSVLGAVRSIAADLPVAPKTKEPVFQLRADITPYVTEFIAGAKYSDLPADVIELGKKSLLDAFGLAIVGAKSKGGEILRSYFDSLGCAGGKARVLGSSQYLPQRFAAFANGAFNHMDDYDDTQLAVAKDRVYGQLTHPTAPVFPAALGLADALAMSGKDFMLGYHVGVEVECKIAEACSPRAYKTGFHSTGVFGVFGSAAACAKLRRMDADKIANAFAIAGSQASGLAENFGTLTKPFHAGHAAEAGVIATDLAMLGWNGVTNILEANNGFFHAYGGSYDADSLLQKLGHPWTFASPGISIKPYPSGSLTHPGMTELARLIESEKIRADDVQQVEVGTNSQMPRSLHYHKPKTGLEGKFSMEYSMASLLVARKVGLAEYTDEVVSRPDMQRMIDRVRFYVDPEAESAGYDKMTTILKIHLKSGRTISSKANFGKGSPANPMSYDEVAEKFRGCTDYAKWPGDRATQIIDQVRHLEDIPDMRSVIALCVEG